MSADRRGFARYTRAERLEQIQWRLDAGMTLRQIAADLGIGYQSVRNIRDDPDGSKQQARRERYQGACKVCGKPTTGCNGRAKAPTLCAQHSNETVNPKVWTREAIIDAIQRFNATNGRPPTADDWIRADSERGYPPRSNVYGRKRDGSLLAFRSWAAAIEAAGFPRPRSGYYQDEGKRRRKAAA